MSYCLFDHRVACWILIKQINSSEEWSDKEKDVPSACRKQYKLAI